MRNTAIDTYTRNGGFAGFLRNAYLGIVEARSRQAAREVNEFLSDYDDAALAVFGYRRKGRRPTGQSAR